MESKEERLVIYESEKLPKSNYENALVNKIDRYLSAMGTITGYIEGGAISEIDGLLELLELTKRLLDRIEIEEEKW